LQFLNESQITLKVLWIELVLLSEFVDYIAVF